MKRKHIYLLLGPKGSGKSFIGSLFEKHFQIPFLRVEDWAKAVKRDRDVDDEGFIKDVFYTIEHLVRKQLEDLDKVVFESTGLTNHFDQMLKSLQSDFKVITIKVLASPQLCLERIRGRDQAIHIDIPEDQINEINVRVLEKDIQTQFVISNENIGEQELLDAIQKFINAEDNLGL